MKKYAFSCWMMVASGMLVAAAHADDSTATQTDDVKLPAEIETQIQSAAKQISDSAWPAVSELANDSATVPLLGLVKTLRQTGFGVASSEPQRGENSGARGGGRGQRGGGGGGRGQRGGGGGGGHSQPTSPEETRAKFDSFDTNRNGVWEKDEINEYMRGQPASNDGIVTYEEYAAAWKALRSGGGQGGGSHRHGGGGHSHGAGGGHSHGGGGGGMRGQGSRGGGSVSVISDAQFVVALDVNRDRQVESAELQKSIANDLATSVKELAKRDSDGDGKITDHEYLAGEKPADGETTAPTRLPRSFSRMDQDADQMVSLDEVVAANQLRLAQRVAVMAACVKLRNIDADRNGSLESKELASLGDVSKAIQGTSGTKLPVVDLKSRLMRLSTEDLASIVK